MRSSGIMIAVVAASCLGPAVRAYAGASCTDACNGPVGQVPCGSLGLGCSEETHQCVRCSSNTQCQPGGTCVDGMCIGLPCSPGADAAVPDAADTDAGGFEDASPSDAETEDAAPADANATDAAPPGGDAGPHDAGPSDAGGYRDAVVTSTVGSGVGPGGTDDHGGCGCSNTNGSTAFATFGIAVLAIVVLSRRARR